MKRIVFVLLLILNLKSFSQQEKLQAIRKLVLSENPELDLNDKLIFVSVWSTNDHESRNINKELSRSVKVYDQARLKGGRRGLCGIIINIDNDASMAKIVSEKDGFSNLKACDLRKDQIEYSFKTNLVLDNNGTVVAKDLTEKEIYPFIQSQLTR